MLRDPDHVSTSIYRFLIGRMKRTHQLRGVSVFIGPPGIGKSTALDALSREEECGAVLVVVTPHGGEKGVPPRVALQLAIEAMEIHQQTPWRDRLPRDTIELRNRLFALISRWVGVEPSAARRDGLRPNDCAPLTIAFDEAQNLSRDALEVLRGLNEARAGFAPFPVGIILSGNDEFALTAGRGGQSVVSNAFRNRTRYVETLTYEHVSDEDLSLLFEARGIVDRGALDLILRHFRTGRRDRSFRRAAFLADDLLEEAEGAPVTPETVKAYLY